MSNPKCSLCKGLGMVLSGIGTMRQCPACRDIPTLHEEKVYSIAEQAFKKVFCKKDTEVIEGLGDKDELPDDKHIETMIYKTKKRGRIAGGKNAVKGQKNNDRRASNRSER